MEYSVIIPVYNCKTYLPACVESIRAARLDSYEIVLVDDGSTDGSGAVCDMLAAQYPQVRAVHQPNAGASGARNRGIREARGRWLLFVDADDSLDAEALGRVLRDPRCAQADLVIFGLTFDYYRNGTCYRRDPLYYDYDGFLTAQDWGQHFEELFLQNSLSPLWNKVFRRELLTEDCRLDPGLFLYEDLEFVLRYLQRCDTVWNVPRAIYHYRQSEDEGNAGRRLKRIASIPDLLAVLEAALDGLRQHNPTLPKAQTDRVLQMLHLILAREKIAVSAPKEIGKICTDFSRWAQNRQLPIPQTPFQAHLRAGRARTLWLSAKKTALRHKVAVWVKSHGLWKN